MIDGHIHFNDQEYSLKTIENMVSVAKEKGIDTLYLLDHTHKFKELEFLYSSIKEKNTYEWYWKKKRISINEYLDFIKLVKSKSWDIDLKFGLEVCYFKETEDEFREFIKDYNFDFLIGSIHFALGTAIDLDKDVVSSFDLDELYKDYFDSMYKCIKSKLFTFLGHPDSIKIFGLKPSFSLLPYYEKIGKLLKEYDLETEDNSGLIRYGFPYPGLDPDLKKYFDKYGVKYHKSSDAHKYEDIGRAFDRY